MLFFAPLERDLGQGELFAGTWVVASLRPGSSCGQRCAGQGGKKGQKEDVGCKKKIIKMKEQAGLVLAGQGWSRSPNPPVRGVVSWHGRVPWQRGLTAPQLVSRVPQIILRAGYGSDQPCPGFCPCPGGTQCCLGSGEASR